MRSVNKHLNNTHIIPAIPRLGKNLNPDNILTTKDTKHRIHMIGEHNEPETL